MKHCNTFYFLVFSTSNSLSCCGKHISLRTQSSTLHSIAHIAHTVAHTALQHKGFNTQTHMHVKVRAADQAAEASWLGMNVVCLLSTLQQLAKHMCV